MTWVYWGTIREWCSLRAPGGRSWPKPLFQNQLPIIYLFVIVFLSSSAPADRILPFEGANPPRLDWISHHARFRSPPDSSQISNFKSTWREKITFYYSRLSFIFGLLGTSGGSIAAAYANILKIFHDHNRNLKDSVWGGCGCEGKCPKFTLSVLVLWFLASLPRKSPSSLPKIGLRKAHFQPKRGFKYPRFEYLEPWNPTHRPYTVTSLILGYSPCFHIAH